MPLVVDKENIKQEILQAFERCIAQKPLLNITLRDIAKEAGMSHGKLLHYFTNKDELIMCYVSYSKDCLSQKCEQWFRANDFSGYPTKASYLNAFLQHVAEIRENETRTIIQLYVLGRYNPKVAAVVKADFDEWLAVIKRCLVEKFGKSMTGAEAEAMMIIIAGIFICNYNNALTGSINENILGSIAKIIY